MGSRKGAFECSDGCWANQEGRIAKAEIALVALYRRYISPFYPASCRFYPSCSKYCQEAVLKHGALKGLGYAIWRVLRCHPFSRGGYDPVE